MLTGAILTIKWGKAHSVPNKYEVLFSNTPESVLVLWRLNSELPLAWLFQFDWKLQILAAGPIRGYKWTCSGYVADWRGCAVMHRGSNAPQSWGYNFRRDWFCGLFQECTRTPNLRVVRFVPVWFKAVELFFAFFLCDDRRLFCFQFDLGILQSNQASVSWTFSELWKANSHFFSDKRQFSSGISWESVWFFDSRNLAISFMIDVDSSQPRRSKWWPSALLYAIRSARPFRIDKKSSSDNWICIGIPGSAQSIAR